MSIIKRRGFKIICLLLVIYAALQVLLPIDPVTLVQYNLSASSARLLKLTFIVPLCLIWFAAYYGYTKFKDYSLSIKDSQDGRAFDLIANGSMCLAFGSPASAVLNLALNHLSLKIPALQNSNSIINNYLSLLIALIAFIFFYRGGVTLLRVIKKIPNLSEIVFGFFILLSVSYCYVVFRESISPSASHINSIYSMPVWLLMTTVVAPYLYTWYKGLIAVFCMKFYESNVKGVIYKQSLNNVANGLTIVILASVAAQFLNATGEKLTVMGLSSILLIIYLLLAVMAAGFILMARGATKLKKIEEA